MDMIELLIRSSMIFLSSSVTAMRSSPFSTFLPIKPVILEILSNIEALLMLITVVILYLILMRSLNLRYSLILHLQSTLFLPHLRARLL